jgi:type I restriction enzyme S subunit
MELRSGYKQTEVGVIPVDWDVKSLGELGEALIGLTYKPSDVRRSGTLVLRSSNIQNDALAFDDNVFVDTDIPERIMVRSGDVLVCVRNGSRALIGKAALLDERAVGMTFGAFMAVYRSPIGKLASYLFQSAILKRQVNEHLGATINQITNKSLNSFRIPISPHDDERADIATALSDVDALLSGLDRLIAKKRDLKLAAMQQLLTGQTRLPGFHGEWKVKRLGDYVMFLRNGVNSRAELFPEGRVKYLHYGDVHACKDVCLSPAALPCLPDAKVASLDRLRDGDLIIADASEDIAGVSKSVEVRGVGSTEVVSGLHTIAARFDKRVLADGFKGFLQFCPPFTTHLRRLAAGTKVYATNRSHVASVEMHLPGIPEQTAIAEALSDMDAELSALEARRDKTRDLKQAMMQELLTGKTRLVPAGAAHA